MRLFIFLVGIILFCLVSSASPTTINGRFTVLNVDSSKFTVLLQVNTNTGTDDLGGATLVFNFDTSAIRFTRNPVKNVDYVVHNFCGGNYSSATVTRPMNDKIWVNIDLPFTNNNNGTVVTGNPGWTDVATIHFDIVDPNSTASLIWSTTSPFWGIYDANNSTLWQNGVFTDLNGPVPVELISFTGTLLSNGSVLLKWKTASELNHYGFEIERASSMTTPVQGWETIGFVESYGHPSSSVEYSFTDITAQSFPLAKYRLKSIDNDGSFKYSDIIEVNITPTHYELSQNYPNPFNPSTTIRFSLPKETQLKINVYNIIGELIETIAEGNYQAGYHKVTFNANNLPSGVYIYRIESSGPSSGSQIGQAGQDFVQTKKMILLK